MQVAVKLSSEDKNRIEMLHYAVEARANLLDRLTSKVVQVENSVSSFNTYMADYDKYYKEYSQFKTELEAKYKPEGNFISWQVNFDSGEMIFEGADE